MVRQLAPEDKHAVMSLIRETAMFTAAEVDVAEELIDIFLGQPDQKDYRVVVVENDGGRIAGYMTWGPTPLTEGAYDVYWMAVSPREQGKGYGKELIRWVEKEVKACGGRLIVIETSGQPRYNPTRQFYIGQNYREVARIPDFYKAGDDRIIYTKAISGKGD